MRNGGIAFMGRRTNSDSSANDQASPDHDLTTTTITARFDHDAERREVSAIENALDGMFPPGYDALVIDQDKLQDDFLRSLAGYLDLDYSEARAIAGRILDGLSSAVHKTDWRAGYGKKRPNATVPEVCAKMILAAIGLVENAFEGGGIQAFRNRHRDFIEAMAEFAAEANGSVKGNQSFYEQLGRRIAREVLEHELAEPRPLLAPQGVEYREIEIAAVTQLVYFIQVGEGGPIKIGIAQNPQARLSSLQTGHHDTLFIRAIGHGGAEQERAYHATFAQHRLRGEWFEPHADILAEIERLSPSPLVGEQ